MELLQYCLNYTQKYYGEMLVEAEKTFADELFDQAEQCMTNEEQRRYFESLQSLKSRASAMRTEFNNQLFNNYDAFIKGNDNESSLDDKIDTTTLSLLDRDELEDDLAISVIISKSNSRNPEALWKLNRRLAVLRGGKTVTDETNPFGPTLICHALQTSVTKLGLDNRIKILIYKHLGHLFVSSFTDILETLNTQLIDKGILPNLHFSLVNSDNLTPPPPPPHGNESETDPSAVTESAKSIAHQQELYNTIRALQSQNGPRTQTASGVSLSGIATGENNAADTFSPLDLALALSAIQQSRTFLSQAKQNHPITTENVEKKLIEQLLKQADESGRHKISQDHADTVDFVGLIFRYMLDDENLHDAVKSLLSHLHTPYLKLALMDSSFLNNFDHSARKLLNLMADVGSLWVKEESDRRVLPTIKKNVEYILRNFVDDPNIFDELLEDFIHFKDNLEKRAKMVEKRNTESQQGLERLELSKQKANEEIKQRLLNVNASVNIIDLLHKPWAEFLAFNLLRHGEKSLAWQSALKVVDGVVWSIDPKEATDSQEDFHRRQIELEQTVKEGLTAIGYDQQASKELLLSLKEAHELASLESMAIEVKTLVSDPKTPNQTATNTQKSTTPTVVRPPNTKPPNVKKAATPKPVVVRPPNTRPPNVQPPNTMNIENDSNAHKKPLTHKEKNMLETLKDIAFGTWFEFKQEKERVELKLAWFSKITSHYMFVDQSGVKQKVENQDDLARGMSSGNISIIEQTTKSFMERAFEAVLDTLKLSE